MYCRECGKQISDYNKFCNYCGMPVVTADGIGNPGNGCMTVDDNLNLTSTQKKSKKPIIVGCCIGIIVLTLLTILLFVGKSRVQQNRNSNQSDSIVSYDEIQAEQVQTEYEPCVITSDISELSIDVGEAVQTKSLYEVNGGSDKDIPVVLESSDEEVAAITDKGNIKGISAGTARITLTYGDAQPVNWNVEVIKIDIADVEAACEKIGDEISSYEYVMLVENGLWGDRLSKVGDQMTIDLNSREQTRVAGLASSVTVTEEYEMDRSDNGKYEIIPYRYDDFGYIGEKISKESLNESCMNLFGKQADISSLTETGNSVLDVIRLNHEGEQTAVRVSGDYETELDFVVRDSLVTKGKKNYKLEQKLYCGYWGLESLGKSNFMFTCVIDRNKDSKYGFTISAMKMERIADEYDWNNHNDVSASSVSPFYGIWCYGVKSEEDAQKGVDELNAKGLDGQMFITTDWGNLNSEKWYVVTAGTYESEAAAKDALAAVKDAGYTNAYVKYTGDYLN